MKKIILILLLISSLSIIYGQSEYKGFGVGIQYFQPTRSDFNDYLKTVADTFSMTNPFKLDKNIGLTGSLVLRGNKTEFEFGGSISKFNNEQRNANSTTAIKMKTTDIGIHMGLNHFYTKFLFLGVQIVLNNFANDLDFASTAPNATALSTKIALPASENFNIFRGYSFVLRGQLGFNIRMGEKSIFRLVPYYDYGVSKSNFITTADHYFNGYKGSQKTGVTGFGIKGIILFVKQ